MRYALKEWQSGKEKKKVRYVHDRDEMETQEFMTRSIHMPKPPWTMYVYVSSRLAFRIHPFARQPAGFSKYSYLHAKIKYHQRLVFINKKKRLHKKESSLYRHTKKSSGDWY